MVTKILLSTSLLVFFLVKTNVAQRVPIDWQLCIGGNFPDNARDVSPANVDGYAITGWSESTDGIFTGNHGHQDVAVVKVSSAGQLEWSALYGGSVSDQGYSIKATADGSGYVVVGQSSSNDMQVPRNHGQGDGWLFKIDNDGTLQWQRSLGGSMSDLANDVIITSDGGMLVAGYTASNDGNLTNAGYKGGLDGWLLKLDANGFIQWSKCFGGTNDDILTCVKQVSDGSYVATGNTHSKNGNLDSHYGPPDYSDLWVIKVDQSGNLLKSSNFGGFQVDYGNDLVEDNSGNIWVAGYTGSSDNDAIQNHGKYDAFLVKLSYNFEKLGTFCYGGNNNDVLRGGIAQLSDGNLLLSATAYSSEPYVSEHIFGFDYWVLKIDTNGNLIYDDSYGGSSNDTPYDLLVTPDNKVVIIGETLSDDRDVSGCTGSNFEFWVVTLDYAMKLSPTELFPANISFTAYPNPFTDGIHLDLSALNEIDLLQLSITDLSGKILWRKTISGQNEIEIGNNLPEGFYLLRAEGNNFKQLLPVIKK